ncbi:MAG: catalase [Proteobacteria bacterium]|nr:catalase [Pseudomonadota bacterium]
MKDIFLIIPAVVAVTACKPRDFNSEALSSSAIPALHPLERVFDDEEKHVADAVKIAEQGVDNAKKSLGKAGRDAHTKAHGCVRAAFTVKDGIPKEFKQGVFAQPKTFPAWIRYSTASGEKNPDTKSGSLGMAIKLMNVAGEKLLENERNEQTQDFLVVNFPFFLVPNLKEYIDLQKWKALYLASHWATAKIYGTIKNMKPADPAESRYWSMSAYALGDSAVKYTAIPCGQPQSVYPEKPSENYLSENLAKHLENRDACFRFAVQPYVNDKLTPVENPMVEWKESDSPFTEVATIQIPVQKFGSKEQQEFCENLSFTPWHSLPVHKPLGNLNRARKKVYEATSRKRHMENNTPRKEPVPD